MERFKVQMLDNSKWFLQKTIAIQQKFNNDVIIDAEILYFRTLISSDYKNDDIDNLIVESVKKEYSSAVFKDDRYILFDTDIDNLRYYSNNKQKEQFEIILTCDVSTMNVQEIRKYTLYCNKFYLDLFYDKPIWNSCKIYKLGSINPCLSVENSEIETEEYEKKFNDTVFDVDKVLNVIQ